ncbi:CBS domain containing-hemolysin-like protein [Georgenia soli]|uniref:CBS domain containing-hemolysin-like protein n=1 Tax=Georgenia soli TaxID=638953 RepID=A0A2A9ENX8_9MICO|nr:hemolysin family protein [Georgenia soli]PFG40674.1 CBS domain containing-hemolysin-like protein [Georgenia soli]
MLTDWLLVLLGVVLTAGTFVFVAAEFSLVALDPGTVDRRVAAGDRRAAAVSRALKHLSLELSSAQVGITATTILLGYTTQAALAELLTGPLGSAGLAEAAAAPAAVVLSLLLVNTFSMVFGELVPKNLALADPLATAGFVAPVQGVFTRALRPVITGLNESANWIIRRFGIEPADELSGGRSASELAALVRRSAEHGTLDVSTATLLTRSIGLGALTAVDVMTDRGRIHTLTREETAADVVDLARATGHSRFPVIGDDNDDIVGLVHLRRAIAVPYDRRAEVPVSSSSLMVDAPRVPETLALAPLLVQLRDEGLQMAVVVDEYGGTSGVVTLEDVVEELVGDVADEHDRRRSGAHAGPGGSWVVPGVMRPDELAHQADLYVPDDGPYETLGGLVMDRLGRIPRVGDEVRVEDVVLHVEQMDGRRVDRLRVWGLPEEAA